MSEKKIGNNSSANLPENSNQGNINFPKEISERKHVEETFRVLENAVEQSIDGIAVADMNGVIRFCNQAWANMHGYSVHELLGKNLSIFHTDEQMKADVLPFNEQVKKFSAHQGEVGHIRKDLTTFSTWMTTTLLKDDKGNSIGLIGIARDISERKKSEERLSLLNKCFLNFGPDPNKNINRLVGLCGELLEADCALYNRLEHGLLCSVGQWKTPEGFNPIDKPDGHICFDLIKQRSSQFLIIHNLAESRYAKTDPNVLKYKLRTYIGLPVRFQGQSIGALCVVYRKDFSPSEDDKHFMQIIASAIAVEEERLCAEYALSKSEQQYRNTLNSMADAMHVVDEDLRFVLCNSQIKKWNKELGLDTEMIGKKLCEVFPFLSSKGRDEYKQVFRTGEILVTEERNRIADKDLITETRKIPIFKDNQVIQVLTVIRDVTPSKQSEERLRKSEEKYKTLTENVSLGLYRNTPGAKGNFLEVNPAFVKMFGYDNRDEIMSLSVCDLYINSDDRIKLSDKISTYGFVKDEEVPLKRKDGSSFIGSVSAVAVRDEQGQIKYYDGIVEDITERRRSEEKQAAMTAGLRAVVEIADELIACPDVKTIMRRAVELAREKLGLVRCAIFVEEENFMRGVFGTDRNGQTTDESGHKFEKDKVWIERLKMLRPHDPRWVVVNEPLYEWGGKETIQIGYGWIVNTPIQSAERLIGVFVNDAGLTNTALDSVKQDTVVVFCSLLGDIIERKRAEKGLAVLNDELSRSNKRFKLLALRDSHTGLYNHRYLQESIDAEFCRAKRCGHPLSVIMLDLDYFKSINDVYGHQFGDLILKQFARQLKRVVRKYDIVIRFGGEEFIIISPGIGKSTALALSQRLLDSINLINFGDEKHSVKLKLSLAVASYPEDKVCKSMDLIELVDKILNKAKEDGGDRVYSYRDRKKGKRAVLKKRAPADNEDVTFLRDKIDKLNKRANQSLIEAIFAFARTIKLKDNYTGEHVENTVRYATDIARTLNLSRDEQECVRRAAMVHDLGKIGISERILLKKAKLSDNEFSEIKKHPQIGADILRPIHSLNDIVPLILYHHERWDGAGYPNGLRQEEIPLGARIVAIADVYQALISDRPYRQAFTRERALKIILDGSGTQFDPRIVGAFLRNLQY